MFLLRFIAGFEKIQLEVPVLLHGAGSRLPQQHCGTSQRLRLLEEGSPSESRKLLGQTKKVQI